MGWPRVLVDRTSVFYSDLGWVATAWLDDRLYALTFGHRDPQRAVVALRRWAEFGEPDPGGAGKARDLSRRLRAYARGHRDEFTDVPIAMAGLTDFQRRVVRACRRIRYGQVVSYGELARRAGAPRAARAVGNVMAGNRIALVVPCHRVVGSGGRLGGYSAPHGLRMKERLLRLEGAGL